MRAYLWVLFVALLCARPVAAIVTTPPVEKDGLRLALSVTQATFHPWTSPRVTWTLTNTGKDTLLIGQWSTSFEVAGKGAKKIPYPGESDYLRPDCPLLPGQHASFTRELSDMDGEWRLDPGTYAVWVVYEVTRESLVRPLLPMTPGTAPPAPPALDTGGRVWTGTLTSGKLTITIAPPNPLYRKIADIYQRTQYEGKQAERTRALLALPPAADAVLLQMLHDGNMMAAEALGVRGVREAVPELMVSAAADVQAIVALGRLGDPRATPAVVGQLPRFPREALHALAGLRDRNSVPAIQPYLKHADARTRAEAMAALQYIDGDPWSVRLLTAYLTPDQPNAYPEETKDPGTCLCDMGAVAVDTVWAAFLHADAKAQRLKLYGLLNCFLQDGVRTDEIIGWLLAREKVAEPYERLQMCLIFANQFRADVKAFLTRMANDPDPDVREAAQGILRDWKGKGV